MYYSCPSVNSALSSRRNHSQNKSYHIVTLSRLVLDSLKAHRIERGSTSIHDATLSPLDGLFKRALGLLDRVGKGKDDRLLVDLAHVGENLLGEGTSHGGQSKESGRLDVLHHFGERLELGSVGFGTGEVALVLGKGIATVVSDESLYHNKGG